MLFGCELALIGAQQADQQEDGAHQHMETMEACGHEEGGAIDRAFEAKGRMGIFISLHAGEDRSQHNGEDQTLGESRAIIVQHAMMRPSYGRARGEQDQRIEQRQLPRVENFGALWGPMATGEFHASGLNRLIEKQAGIKEGPEPCHEEHDFGGDEQDHAIAMADLHHTCVITRLGFMHDISPPGQHHIQNANEASDEQEAAHFHAEQGQALHPHDRANGGDECGDGANQRPWARVDEVVIVIGFCVTVSHGLIPLCHLL